MLVYILACVNESTLLPALTGLLVSLEKLKKCLFFHFGLKKLEKHMLLIK